MLDESLRATVSLHTILFLFICLQRSVFSGQCTWLITQTSNKSLATASQTPPLALLRIKWHASPNRLYLARSRVPLDALWRRVQLTVC